MSVHYAATQVEAHLCGGDPVAVVGGGNSAGQATLFLSRHVPVVRLIILHDDLGRDMSRYLVDRDQRTPNVEVMRNTALCELVGEKVLEAIEVEDTRSGERRRVDARALFVFIGAAPCTDWLEDQLALDSGGYVLTGEEAIEPGVSRDPSLLETSQPGVFAAGDVKKRVNQARRRCRGRGRDRRPPRIRAFPGSDVDLAKLGPPGEERRLHGASPQSSSLSVHRRLRARSGARLSLELCARGRLLGGTRTRPPGKRPSPSCVAAGYCAGDVAGERGGRASRIRGMERGRHGRPP